MAPRSSPSDTLQTPTMRHHANTRTTIMKTKSVQHLQVSPLNTSNPKSKMMRRRCKSKSNATISTTTSTPSIALLLTACHSLDHLICSPTTPACEISKWHALDSWTYLTSPLLIARWKSSLKTLCQEFLNGIFTPDMFEEKLMALLPGVQKLEEARRRVNEELEGELSERGVWVVVPEAFWEAVEERAGVIDEVFEGMGRVLDEQ